MRAGMLFISRMFWFYYNLDESNYPRAYNKHIRPLRRRSLIDIIQDDDGTARLYIHDIVKDWSDEYNALSGARLRGEEQSFHFVQFP